MSIQTVSEELFARHCQLRRIPHRRLAEVGTKVADFEVKPSRRSIFAEVKQIDENDRDRSRELLRDCQEQGMGLAPVKRVRGMIAAGYPQLKPYSKQGHPCLLVTYNNAGLINFIDEFTATKAMFGSPGIVLAPNTSGVLHVVGQGFGGGRRVTRNTCRALSGLCVLETGGHRETHLSVYHNPYAENPIDPMEIQSFADHQYVYDDPHAGPWAQLFPTLLEI